MRRWSHPRSVVLICVLVCYAFGGYALSQPGRSVAPYLQERFGLTEAQVRGALGALLVLCRDRLAKPEFDDLAAQIPNADQIMQETKLRGIVNGPLDDLDDYEATLLSLGIGQPLASQFAPAVVEYLGASGYDHERDILARVVH